MQNDDQRWSELIKIIASADDPEKIRRACEELDRLAELREAATQATTANISPQSTTS